MADTLQQWADYIDEYEANMVEVRQRTETILSNPQSTAQDKQDALEEQYRQETHLRELKSQYATYSALGEVPSTVEFGGSSSKTPILFYKTNVSGDNAIHHGTAFPISGSGDLHLPDSEIALGTVFTSDLLSFSARLKNNGYTVGAYSDINLTPWREEVAGTSITWGFESDTAMSNGWVSTKFTPSGYTITLNDVSWTQNRTICPCIKGAYRSINDPITINQGYSFAAPITLALLSEIENPYAEVPGDSPWDYYNEELLPRVPDNPAFPNGYEPEPDTSDPGDTEPIETPVITGDDMELQTDRTLSAPSDFITMYMITPPILSQFGRTLWTSLANYNPQDPTSVDVFKNFYAVLNEQVTGSLDIGSIMNFIVSVRQYPFAVSDITNIYELVGNSISFGTGALPIDCGSAAQVYRLTSTIGVLDLGSVTIADYNDFKLYNDFRDYYNTSVSAYLPYCGTVELNPIEAINSTIHCFYAIDFYTGECTAFLTTTSEDGNTIVSGSKSGTIGVLVPITATNSGQVAARHLSDNAKDSMLITSASGNLFGIIGGIATGNIMGAVSNATGLAQIGAQQKMLDAERQGRSAVMAPSLSGGVGAAAFISPATASILVRRGTYARQKISNYPQTCGYPETSSGQLKTYKGYTECYNVNVDSINCTEEEKAAIKLALESGVYLPTDL